MAEYRVQFTFYAKDIDRLYELTNKFRDILKESHDIDWEEGNYEKAVTAEEKQKYDKMVSY